MKLRISFVTLILITSQLLINGQTPVFNSVMPNSNAPARFDKFELNINLTAGYTNPYDYDDISVQCIFLAPGGRKDTVDGFFMQDYTLDVNGNLTADGTGTFKVRYAPNETGTWSYVLSCKNLSGTTVQPAQTFTCVTSAAPGFLRKNATNYLSFDNGNQFFPIGENMGWQDGNVVTDYTNWLTKLSDNGGNFIRVWMSSWAFALEWQNDVNNFSGLKKYKQSSAFYLDWLLDYCRQKNIYTILTLNNHGQVSTGVNPEWSNNPYNAANGGPATNTWDFFTNATARSLHKNRLRYIIARFGYSQSIQSWELFNEVEWTDQYDTHKADVKNWHEEMANYIKSKDVYRHLVTTSFAHDYNDDATWNIPAIDFTQTHFYVNVPNIESVLGAATQNYLMKFQKPTLNGEFGLGADGAGLSADDANGVHLHNAIWGSSFSGAMGSALTWWWDTYIDPQNLYHHFKPLSSVVSHVNFKGDNYKQVTAATSGGGTSDITISPGGDFAKSPASDFTIDAGGAITPAPSSLSQYLFGSTYNTELRNPPTFTVNYPVAGKFEVVVSGVSNDDPKITIYLDGVQLLNADAAAGNTYSINVPAGQHAIKADNLGVDWAQVSGFIFTNIGYPLTTYVLKSAANNKAAGYLLNNRYNWQYLKSSGNVPPAPVQGSSIIIPGMQNGTYAVSFFSTSTGDVISTADVPVVNGLLSASLPDIAWDIAFTAAESSVLPIYLYSLNGERKQQKNYLYIDIAISGNVNTVFVERSPDAVNFISIKKASTSWNSVNGRHTFIDEHPNKGLNFYRLKIIDSDGKETYSNVVKLVNTSEKFSIYPNPFKSYLILSVAKGMYFSKITDVNGKTVRNEILNASSDDQHFKFSVATLNSGVYYLSVLDEQGNRVATEKLVK